MTERLKNANLRWETGEIKAWDFRELCGGGGNGCIPSLWDRDKESIKIKQLVISLNDLPRIGMTPVKWIKRGAI